MNKDVRHEIERFDRSIEEHLSDQNFIADDTQGFYFQDELADAPTGIIRAEKDYGDMVTADALDAEDIDDDLLDIYLNAELIFDVGTGNERKG